MIVGIFKSIVTWANDYFHYLWITTASILLFALTYLCFVPIKNVGVRPHLLAVGDFLILIRATIPEDYARPVGLSSFAIGVLLMLFTTPRLKKDFAKFQEGMRKDSEKRREWERKNGIR
jgi:membrane-bound ClpP family serine protease